MEGSEPSKAPRNDIHGFIRIPLREGGLIINLLSARHSNTQLFKFSSVLGFFKIYLPRRPNASVVLSLASGNSL